MTDAVTRCPWCVGDTDYVDYHDKVWGVPVRDDRELFEFLTLEGFQAGVSWIMILKKQKNFQRAFDNFDIEKVANYGPDKVEELLQDAGIIRNRSKIEAAVTNAQAVLRIQREYGSLSQFLWKYVDNVPIVNAYKNMSEVPAKTELSTRLSKEFKKQGIKYMGPVTTYAFMQAMGMVNDHLVNCDRWATVQELA